MKYRVYVDANPPQMDTSQRTLHGEYETREQAIDAAREIVRARLVEAHRPGMTAEALLERFARRGETAFILPLEPDSPFDANEYARERAARLCWSDALRK